MILDYKMKLNEDKMKKYKMQLKTNQFINPHSICIFDDTESCTNRRVMFDGVAEPINKCIYSIISSLSVAGRSHSPDKPTIEYICIQHYLAVGGQIRAFNTILLESNFGLKITNLQ